MKGPINIYKGIRTKEGAKVLRNEKPLNIKPSLKLVNHSPTGFEWGYRGSGPAQLALALLLDVLGKDKKHVVLSWYQIFKFEVVSRLPREGWELTSEEIRTWLKKKLKQWIGEIMEEGKPSST